MSGVGSLLTARSTKLTEHARYNLLAGRGACVSLTSCTLTCSRSHHGLSCRGEGTEVTLSACVVNDNKLNGLYVTGEAKVGQACVCVWGAGYRPPGGRAGWWVGYVEGLATGHQGGEQGDGLAMWRDTFFFFEACSS